MGNNVEMARLEGAKRDFVTKRVIIPENLLVCVANVSLMDHGWKDNCDISETYAKLLRQSPKVAALLRLPRHDGAETPKVNMPVPEAYLNAGRPVSAILELPSDLASAIVRIGREESRLRDAQYDFSRTMADLIMDVPGLQIWAKALYGREKNKVPLRASD